MHFEITMQEHLFISYATEDSGLAEWLTLKLTSLGYKVWCDRFELLGGERFPRDIDKAIKEKTFRLLALLSKASLEKENPTKERTLALNIGRERKNDFLIPLKVEQLSATDLNWMVSDITYVPFHPSWANGLSQLVKKLEKIGAPKILDNGCRIAAEALLDSDLVEEKPEELHSNLLEVARIPECVQRFQLRRPPNPPEIDQMNREWPAYRVEDRVYLSFQSPSESLADKLNIQPNGKALWRDLPTIDGIKSETVVSNLLKRNIEAICLGRGLIRDHSLNLVYFPSGLLNNNRLSFLSYDGKRTHLLAVGQRSKAGVKYRYHLAPQFQVRRDFESAFSILMKVRVRITDTDGKALPRFSALSRRKHLCAQWWNSEWLKRQLAILEHLSNKQDFIAFGHGNEQVNISAHSTMYSACFGINEASLGVSRTEEETAFLESEAEAFVDEKVYEA